LQVGTGEVAARYLGGVSHCEDFVDHFRATGDKRELHWEERWIRDEGISKIVPATIRSLLDKTGVAASTIRISFFRP